MSFDFTVLIPNYNTPPDQLFEAVYSVLNQSYAKPFKILIVDDSSHRIDTLWALECLEKNPRITVEYLKENGGTSIAMNVGHKLIETPYIAIMGADDISHAKRFETQIEIMKRDPKIDICGTNLFSFYSDDISRKPLMTTGHPKIPVPRSTNKWWITNHGTVIYKKEKIDSLGGYDPLLRRAQDVDLWQRAYEKGLSFYNVQSVLYAWRRRR